jgi:hypothetical protein
MPDTPLPPVDLPIIYTDASAYFAAFPCPLRAAAALLPDPQLKPIALWPGAACITVAVFDYRETTIGPYGEVGVGIPCRYGRTTAIPLVPLLLERALDDVGYWLVQLPVTTEVANEAGKAIWGYPKFVAGIDIRASDREVECTVSEGGAPVFRATIVRPGPSRPIRMPLRTYSRLDDEIHLAEVAIDGIGRIKKLGAEAALTFEDHPRNAALGELPRSYRGPIEVRWFDQYRIRLDRARAKFRILP